MVAFPYVMRRFTREGLPPLDPARTPDVPGVHGLGEAPGERRRAEPVTSLAASTLMGVKRSERKVTTTMAGTKPSSDPASRRA